VPIRESGAVITHDPLPTAAVEPSQMVQVFQNLLGNAIKFRSQRAPAIHVGAQRHEDGWRFSVRDNGIGIERQYFERIFRGLPAPAHAGGVSRLGDRPRGLRENRRSPRRPDLVRIRSEPGTTFYFSLPDVWRCRMKRFFQQPSVPSASSWWRTAPPTCS